MTERAQVLSVDGAIATVRCDTTESCSSCSSILCNPRSRTYEASWGPAGERDAPGGDVLAANGVRDPSGRTGDDTARLAPGDWVEVEVTEAGALGKGLLLFVLPLALFVAAYLGLGALSIARDVAEVVQVAGGFGGLVVGVVVAVFASRLWKEPAPRIVQVYRAPALRPVELPVSRE